MISEVLNLRFSSCFYLCPSGLVLSSWVVGFVFL